jgi:hypothetical protein
MKLQASFLFSCRQRCQYPVRARLEPEQMTGEDAGGSSPRGHPYSFRDRGLRHQPGMRPLFGTLLALWVDNDSARLKKEEYT